MIRTLGIELRERCLVGRPRFAHAAGSGENVAAKIFVHASEGLVAPRIERAQRVVVLLRIELYLREADTRDLFQLVFVRTLEHGLELRCRTGGVARFEHQLRDRQRRARRIAGAAELCGKLRRGFLRLLHVVRFRGGTDGGEQHRSLLRLVSLPPPPALHGEDAEGDRDHDAGDEVAPLLPPSLEVVQLFLLFKIVDCHFRVSCPVGPAFPPAGSLP